MARPGPAASAASDYARMEGAQNFLSDSYLEKPSLDAVAEHVCLSPHHFQLLFRRWASISPKRFVQYLTLAHAKRALAESRTVPDVGFAAGRPPA